MYDDTPTITVEELMDLLGNFDPSTPVYFVGGDHRTCFAYGIQSDIASEESCLFLVEGGQAGSVPSRARDLL